MTEPSVLIAEDDPELRSVLRRGLAERGFAPEAVGTGGELLARVDSESPDLLVIDIGLPDTDGRDLCQALRARGIDTPELFLTPRDALVDRIAGFAAGGALSDWRGRARRPYRRLGRGRRRLTDEAVRVRRARRACPPAVAP